MPRKIKRNNVEIAYTNTGSLRAEDLPFDAVDSIKANVDARTVPAVTTLDNGKLSQAYYDTPAVYGDGADGNVSISSAGAGIELTYVNDVTDMTADAVQGATVINVRDASAFSPGDEVMLHQTQCWRDQTKRFQYEFRRIASINVNEITLAIGLSKAFDSDSGGLTGEDTKTQVIRVPNYDTLTLNAGGGICARPWDGYSGGILAFRAFTLAGAGLISATDAGFRKVTLYVWQNEARAGRCEGPLGSWTAYLRSAWDPTGPNENYHAGKHDATVGGSASFGGSACTGTNNVIPSVVTAYASTPYTKDGVNPLTAVDMVDYLPMGIAYMTYISSTFRNPFEGFPDTGIPRNIGAPGANCAGGSVLCFVQSHVGFTGSLASRQINTDGEPNSGGHIVFLSESNFTGSVDVTTNINGRNGVFGDNGLFHTDAPAGEVNKGFQHGPKVVTSDAGSAAGDILARSASDERYGASVARSWQPVVNGYIADPPGAPTLGDRYLINATATGAWAGQEDKIAEWNGTSWVFYTPVTGWMVAVDSDTVAYKGDVFQYFDGPAVGEGRQVGWEKWLDQGVASTSSPNFVDVQVSAPGTMQWNLINRQVLDEHSYQEAIINSLDTPPVTPGIGDRYRVIATATGDWVGQEDKIAVWRDGPANTADDWYYYTPVEGARVYDQTSNEELQYNGASWVSTNMFETDPVVGAVTGIVKADGGGNIAAAVAGTDYVATETDPVVGAINGLVKSNGAGTIAAAVAGTDYVASETDPIVGAVNGLVKSNGAGTIAAAVKDTDYQGVPVEGAFADGDKTNLDNLVDGLKPVVTETGTAKTLALTDLGSAIRMDNAAANVLTIPTNASVAIPIGAYIPVRQVGAGATTITADTGVTLNGVSAGSGALSGQWKEAYLHKVGTDAWEVVGDVGIVA